MAALDSLWTVLSVITLPFYLIFSIIYGSIEYALGHKVKRYQERIFTPKGAVKRIAVIGGGCSGITSAKEALEAGFEVVVFEQTECLGGNWVLRKQEAHASIYKSTSINTSKQMMCFSDYPMADYVSTYPTHEHIVKYFNDYADEFGVRKYVRFNTQVVSVEQDSSTGKWTIKSRPSDGTPLYLAGKAQFDESELKVETFDAVMIANGHHSVPRTASFPGQDHFKGHIMHSHGYRDPKTPYDFSGKRVVVVGIGNSGADLATELSRVGHVYLSTRSGAWVIPKFLVGFAMDHLAYNRILMVLLPLKAVIRISSMILQLITTIVQGRPKGWNLDPGVGVFQAHVTMQPELLGRIGTGTVVVKPNIKQFEKDGHSIRFEDGTVVDHVDAVVNCTGYIIKFDFFKDQDKMLVCSKVDKRAGFEEVSENQVRLFENVWNPELCRPGKQDSIMPPTIAFIGLVQPLGAIMPISEIQARWATLIWSGALGLPSQEDMVCRIEDCQRELKKRYLHRARHTIQVDFPIYLETIATYIGCVPSIKNNKDILKELLLLPTFPPSYRLEGPGAKKEVAAKMLLKFWDEIHVKRPELKV